MVAARAGSPRRTAIPTTVAACPACSGDSDVDSPSTVAVQRWRTTGASSSRTSHTAPAVRTVSVAPAATRGRRRRARRFAAAAERGSRRLAGVRTGTAVSWRAGRS